MVGNLSNFTKIDILRCLLRIEKPVSRSRLSDILYLGEGTVRSILDILKKNNLLESNKQGHFLSKKGKAIANKIRNSVNIVKVNLDNIFPDKKKIAIHIKSIKNKNIGKSYELRDIAVKNGADGALILEYDGKLKFYELGGSDSEHNFKEIESRFELSNEDIVIISYADSYKLAEHGALAVTMGLCDDVKKFMQELK